MESKEWYSFSLAVAVVRVVVVGEGVEKIMGMGICKDYVEAVEGSDRFVEAEI